MNERIEQLWTQAEERHVDADGKVWVNTIYKTRDKFAELIVNECADVAKDYVITKNSELVDEVQISSYQLRDKILDHFGIE